MKASYPLVVLAWLVGVGIGATGIGALYAQSHTSPGYFVAESVVTDQDTFQKFLTQVPATMAAFKGRYVVRGGTIERVTGEPPARLAIIAFPSAADARRWYESPAYKAIRPMVEKSATLRQYIVEGVSP